MQKSCFFFSMVKVVCKMILELEPYQIIASFLFVFFSFLFTQEKLALKGELSQTNQRVAMQSEYCAGMGSVCCTLLWRASQHEEAIPALLVGVGITCDTDYILRKKQNKNKSLV